MKEIILENEKLKVKVNCHGAELRSVYGKDKAIEYLWNADAKYWDRSSPVLFPFVGSVKNKTYRHEGQEYSMGQHGFARDMEFEVISQNDNEAWFGVNDTEETYKVYPFHFRLEIGYRLEGNSIVVMWKVKNLNDSEMHFSIGAHPAFFCPLYKGDKQSDYYLSFADKEGKPLESFMSILLGEGGLVKSEAEEYRTENGKLQIVEDLFDIDTLILENNQAQRVALLDSEKQEYVAVEFTAPVVGIWSPPRKNAPFVCIEPWYGRCDNEAFDGELKDREWGNTLGAGEEFQAEYRVIV